MNARLVIGQERRDVAKEAAQQRWAELHAVQPTSAEREDLSECVDAAIDALAEMLG
jgi:hypothetical protein